MVCVYRDYVCVCTGIVCVCVGVMLRVFVCTHVCCTIVDNRTCAFIILLV